jgi:hypothetical protein
MREPERQRNDPSKMMIEPNPAPEAAELAAAKTATPPPIAEAPAPAAAAAAPVNAAAQHTAVRAAITALNSATAAFANAGTVNSHLAFASSSCKQAVTWLTEAAAAAPTA